MVSMPIVAINCLVVLLLVVSAWQEVACGSAHGLEKHEPLDSTTSGLAFHHWMKSHGFDPGSFPLRPGLFSGTRGMQATRDIKQGEVVLSIPNTMVITSSSVLQAKEIGEIIAPLRPKLPDKALLALFLLHERAKGSRSAWAPYLETIPAEVDSLLSFSDKEIQQVSHISKCRSIIDRNKLVRLD